MKSLASTLASLSALALLSTALLPLSGCYGPGGGSCCGPSDRAAPASSYPAGGNTPPQAAPARPAEITYTCPMHPEVVQPSPGKCPKCGMDLVRKG